MNSRIVMDDTGRNVDEHLEVCFRQVFELNIDGEQGEAIEKLLRVYTDMIFGEKAVQSDGIINHLGLAILWALQFGELRIHDLSPTDKQTILNSSGLFAEDIAFGAKIGPDRPGQNLVCGSTIHQVVLLAGIQVLRETAYGILNSDKGETSH